MRRNGLALLTMMILSGINCFSTFDPTGTTQVDPAKTCASDANCDDGNPCTIDTCQSDKTCESSTAPDGPLSNQIAGDCKRNDCKAGQTVTLDDSADIADDNEPCTTDLCNQGTPLHINVVESTPCTIGVSLGKCVLGVCIVECGASKPCDDNNPCTEDTCNAALGTCTFVPLDGLPPPGFQEPVGDCKLHICFNGQDAPLNDDADTPDDQNPCTQDVCTNGVPSNPGVEVGTPCVLGQPDVCDGTGACVACNTPNDCVLLPADDDCQRRTCTNHQCGQTFTTMGTPTSAQKPGDCKQVVCNGIGGTLVIAFDTDLPEDNNPCTKNLCNGGVPSNPNESAGFSCGSPLICDGGGICVGCNQPSDCVFLPADDFCKKRVCINQVCSLQLTASGTDLPAGQTSQDCKVIECDAQGNIVTSVDLSDKPIDGNQCTADVCSAQGNPSNPFEAVNVACMQSGGTACNGAGACKKANGATCSFAGDCLSGFCVDGVCCNSTCGTSCKSCNVPGSIGTCVNVPKASEDLPGCTGANSCDGSGTCRKDDGQVCAMGSDCASSFCTDGVCCASACTTACRACNLAGSVGICSNITSGQDNVPMNVCNGMNACDPSGSCKLNNGQVCTVDAQCVDGHCVDGVCCNSACTGTCMRCNVAGSAGTCSNIPAGTDPDNECAAPTPNCNGAGACN